MQLSNNHAIDIACDPVPGDPAHKVCKCIEPQPSSGVYNTVYGGATLGINDTPSGEFCQTVTCNALLGPSWRACPGGETKSTCDNVNSRDKCPPDCCVDVDGTVPPWCGQCKVPALPTCGNKPPAGNLQCVTCRASGDAPRCEGTTVDADGKTVPNGVTEPCGDFGFLVGGKCPGLGSGWSDASGPTGCNAR